MAAMFVKERRDFDQAVLPCGAGSFVPSVRLTSSNEVQVGVPLSLSGTTWGADDVVAGIASCCTLCAGDERCSGGFVFVEAPGAAGNATCVLHASNVTIQMDTCDGCTSYIRMDAHSVGPHLLVLKQLHAQGWVERKEYDRLGAENTAALKTKQAELEKTQVEMGGSLQQCHDDAKKDKEQCDTGLTELRKKVDDDESALKTATDKAAASEITAAQTAWNMQQVHQQKHVLAVHVDQLQEHIEQLSRISGTLVPVLKEDRKPGITLALHGDVSRIDVMLFSRSMWQGPTAVAVLVYHTLAHSLHAWHCSQ